MLSIIIPCCNEQDSLVELHQQITDVTTVAKIDYEIIFVDDGSTDSTWEVISELAAKDSQIQGIQFRRNFGKAAGLTAAMKAASGDLILMMDADLQDDPAEIPKFLAKLEEGNDVVNGWKLRRLDPWHKVYPSKVFNAMISRLSGLSLHDHNCGLKLFRAEVASEIRIYGELHRFIAVLAHARGFKVVELPVNHRPREFGVSKYGVKRFLRGFLDLLTVSFLTSYGQRPQHLLGGLGLFFFVLGSLGLSYLALLWILMHVFDAVALSPIGSRPLLLYSLGLQLLGAQSMFAGMLAELIISEGQKDASNYSVKQTVGKKTAQQETATNES